MADAFGYHWRESIDVSDWLTPAWTAAESLVGVAGMYASACRTSRKSHNDSTLAPSCILATRALGTLILAIGDRARLARVMMV